MQPGVQLSDYRKYEQAWSRVEGNTDVFKSNVSLYKCRNIELQGPLSNTYVAYAGTHAE